MREVRRLVEYRNLVLAHFRITVGVSVCTSDVYLKANWRKIRNAPTDTFGPGEQRSHAGKAVDGL